MTGSVSSRGRPFAPGRQPLGAFFIVFIMFVSGSIAGLTTRLRLTPPDTTDRHGQRPYKPSDLQFHSHGGPSARGGQKEHCRDMKRATLDYPGPSAAASAYW